MKNSTANVTSIDAVRQLRAGLLTFGDESRQALVLLALEVRKAVDWIEMDRLQYWPSQVRRSGEELIQARNNLERCQLKYGSEDAPPCTEQKKAFERAKRRVRLCEEKLRVTRRWVSTIRQKLNEFEGQLAKMNNCLDNDLPRAVAALERMLQSLEKYTSVELSADLPAGSPRPAAASDTGQSLTSDETGADPREPDA